jgi:hypothetical protein
MENTTKIKRIRRPQIDPDDAFGIGVVEQIFRGSVENHPYVAVVEHGYDSWMKLEALIIPQSRIIAGSKVSKPKSVMVGQAHLEFVTTILEPGTP